MDFMPQAVLEIPITCPEGPQRCVECAECVRQRLLNRPGIREVAVHPAGTHARIILDYDSQQLTLGQLEREVRRSGACFSPQWGHAVLAVEGMVSPQSEQVIESTLNHIPGVMATASYASGMVRVEFDRSQCAVPKVVDQLARLGYRVKPVTELSLIPAGGVPAAAPREPLVARVLRWLSANPELAMPLLGALFLLAAYVLHVSQGIPWLRAVLLVGSFLCSARYTGVETLRNLRHFRMDIELLMFVAAAGAILLGRPEEGALLLVLFGLGTAGENLAMDRARRAINALAELAPDTAILREADGRERVVRTADLKVGDQVVIRPFDRLPVDGVVHSGVSSVDESALTGESMPIEKFEGAELYAGTMNGDGGMVMTVTRSTEETKLARIIRLVAEAQTTRSPTQVLTDRVERWYVPMVFVGSACLIVLPTTLGGGAWSEWFYRAMAFLTAASPCALAIGTPAAVLSGIARAARGGVLIKGGIHLENLGRVRAIAFDKTGTLTRGKAQVTDVLAYAGHCEEEILSLTAALEREASAHPLATAIIAAATARGVPRLTVQDAKQIPGLGISGLVDGKQVEVGRPSSAGLDPSSEILRTSTTLEEAGKTAVFVRIDGVPAGIIALADTAREAARGVLDELRGMGVKRTVMLTGDNIRVATAVAKIVNVDEFSAGLMPEEKVERIRELTARYGATAMVGDGVNDAPALATATVGIAMGGVGTDVALETADVALMSDALERLPDAIGLSRFSRKIIAENLIVALGVIFLMAPAAALGFTTLGLAVVAHEGSTVLVVLNALRLLVYKSRKPAPGTAAAPALGRSEFTAEPGLMKN